MATISLGRRSIGSREAELSAPQSTTRVRLDHFPTTAGMRWILRLALSLPFVALALLEAASPGLSSGTTVNQDLVAQAARIDWTRADIAWVGELYPPIGTVLTAIIPGGTSASGIAGGLLAGPFLLLLIEVMRQRRFHPATITIFIIALAANPLFAYTVTENFEAFLGIAFYGLGAISMVRFIVGRNTQAGFRAGILFMIAALSGASGIVYVVVAGITAPLLTWLAAGAGARGSSTLVVLFPTVSTFVTVEFLQIVFLHNPLAGIGEKFHYDPALWAIVPHLFTSLDGFLLLAPMLSGWALALAVRRPGAILISTILIVALIVGYVLGLIPVNSAGDTFLIMTVTGISILPAARTIRSSLLVSVVAGAQIVIAWAAAFNRPIVLDWMHSLLPALGWS